jgi:hypothetical protein
MLRAEHVADDTNLPIKEAVSKVMEAIPHERGQREKVETTVLMMTDGHTTRMLGCADSDSPCIKRGVVPNSTLDNLLNKGQVRMAAWLDVVMLPLLQGVWLCAPLESWVCPCR